MKLIVEIKNASASFDNDGFLYLTEGNRDSFFRLNGDYITESDIQEYDNIHFLYVDQKLYIVYEYNRCTKATIECVPKDGYYECAYREVETKSECEEFDFSKSSPLYGYGFIEDRIVNNEFP